MIHPDEKCNLEQAKFLATCPPDQKKFHEIMFRVGNATIWYHRKAKEFKPREIDWNEWLDGLPENVRIGMRAKGFEACKGILSFTRYVMEKNDQGLDAFLKENLSEEDFLEYSSMKERSSLKTTN